MNSFLETLKELGPARLGIMGAIILGLLLFFVFVSLRISTPEMKLLYKDLSTVDSSSIAAKLEESKIGYEVSEDGSRVMVSQDNVGRARMLLAESGLPNGGSMGYEIFDQQSGFGQTNFIQNINQVRALEGELGRTISSLDKIRSARVHLVLPQRELFSRDTRPASASVSLGLRPGAILEQEEIVAIQSLVASAVPDLKATKVTIIDSNGNLLANSEGDDVNLMSLKAEEMRRSMESRLTQKVEDQVSRIVGYGKVRATVTAEMNFDRINTSEELFDPEKQVVRSTQTTQENNLEREPPPKELSVENNLPGAGEDLLVSNQPSAENNKVEEVTNYEISKTVRNTVREAGEVLRLSVAVLVDGKYAKDAEGNETYEPRSQEEIDQIRKLVESAVGLNAERGDKIEIVNMQFAKVDTDEDAADERMLFGFEKADLLDTAEILTVAVMIILVILLVLQPMVGRLMEATRGQKGIDETLEAELLAARPATAALTGPDGMELPEGEDESLVNIQGVEGKVKASTLKKVEEIVENYPAETVSVLRSWMAVES